MNESRTIQRLNRMNRLKQVYEVFEGEDDVAYEMFVKADRKLKRHAERKGFLYRIPSGMVGLDENDPTVFTLFNIRGVLGRFRVKKGRDEVVRI